MRYKNEDDFAKAVKANGIDGLYLLYGEEQYLINIWRSKLTKEFGDTGDFNLHRLEGRGLDVDALYDAVEALPLMAQRKCVIVDDLDPGKLSASDMAKLEEILSDPAPDCVLVITGKAAFDAKSAAAKKIIKLAEASGSAVELGARGQSGLVSFLKNQAKECGCELSTTLANQILTDCGADMNTLRCEVAKVCARAGYGDILPQHIQDVVIPRTEARVFDLGKAILSGNIRRAMDILSDLFYLREEPIMILSTLIMSYMDLYRARIARDSGISQDGVISRFNYKGREFRVRNAMNTRISTNALRLSLDALHDCDRKMKSTGVDNKILLEQTVIKLFMAAV